MRPRLVRSIIVVALIAIAGVLAGLVYVNREPVYLGHPISYWVEPWHHHATESPEREAAAFAEMDDRAVRWLAGRLGWRPSKLKEGFARTLNRLGDFMSDSDYDDGRRSAALRALLRLGPRARAAIPALEELRQTNVELHRDEMRAGAVAALIRIRGDSLAPYIERLETAVEPEWTHLTLIFAAQETNAAAAVPALVASLNRTNGTRWAAWTIHALGRIHSRPELCVPALQEQLTRSNPFPSRVVFQALSEFETNAQPAWPLLTNHLSSITNGYDRQALLFALRRIDPVACAANHFE